MKKRRSRSLPYKHRSKIESSELLRRLLYLGGAILLIIFFCVVYLALKDKNHLGIEIPTQTKVSALSNGIVEAQDKLKQSELEVQKTQEEINQISSQTSITDQNKDQVATQTAALQDAINKLKDSFVYVTKSAPDSAGNSYAPGNCTYYVKEMRPDLPNNLGNANQWYINAASEGFKVGSKPKVGAIGVSYEGYAGHVVYVQKIRKNGDVIISEMNYGGLWNMNTREVSASSFVYIYSL